MAMLAADSADPLPTLVSEVDKLLCTKATVTCGLLIENVEVVPPGPVAGVAETKAMICPGTPLAPGAETALALPRTLVMRKIRFPAVPGASTGVPTKITEFPATTPWNTLGLTPFLNSSEFGTFEDATT